MAHHPPRQKLVIARVELVLPQPVVVRETVQELWVFEDDRSVGSCTARKTWKTAIDMCAGANFDVTDRQTECREDLPNCHAFAHWLDTLTRAYASNLLVFKTCEHIWQKRRWPNSIVVCKDNDVCRGIPDTVCHLQPLVRERNGEDANTLRVNGVGKFLERNEHFLFGDDDDLFRFASKPTVGCFLEFFTSVNGGYDDSDIF